MQKKRISRNIDDYIVDADDSRQDKESKKIALSTAIGLTAVAIIGGTIYAVKSSPKQEYPIEHLRTEMDDKASSGSSSGDKSASFELDLSKSDTPEKDLTLPKYSMAPSSEIVNADPMSGTVQLGNYLFTLPCTLSAFTDAGFKIFAIDNNLLSEMTGDYSDMTLKGRTSHSVVVMYDEYTYYPLETYDKEEVYVLGATVVQCLQSETSQWYDEHALPMFIPGGIHVGSDATQASYFDGDPHHDCNSFGFHLYNGPIRLIFNPNNHFYYAYSEKDGEVVDVGVMKNY